MSDPNANRLEATVSSITTDLLSRAQANDKPAWDHLVDLYGPLVYQWCRQRGLEAQDASDVAQYSPMLADRLGVRSDEGLDVVVEKILQVLQP